MRNLTQEQLAERVEMSAASISRYENGHQPYNQEILEKLAVALNVEPADLLAGPPPPDELELREAFGQLDQERRKTAIRLVQALAA